jgi:cobalamin biosynthesis protein CbiG
MRTKLNVIEPETALNRILDALERELIDASDEEILEAAKDLGMNPLMKGSAAFLGLQTLSFAEFFESEALREVLARARTMQIAAATQLEPKGEARQPTPKRAIDRKGAADK